MEDPSAETIRFNRTSALCVVPVVAGADVDFQRRI
jgi:hypothetical protein